MKSKIVKVGNAQAFWGDTPTAPARLVQQQPDLDYLTLDYLSELSMSILAMQQAKNPSLGYAKDFLDVIRSLVPFWQKGSRLKVISNAGGLNPLGCAIACQQVLKANQCEHLKIGIVQGDDVLAQLQQEPRAPLYANLETLEPLGSMATKLATANAYLGAEAMVSLLAEGADVIITGRIADPSMAVAPIAFYHQWSFDAYDQLAQATLAGHLIECGTQTTGGFSNIWMSIPDPANIGFPFVEVAADGSFVLTKPEASSGMVNTQTVKEQLLYEINHPACYLSPDVTASFLNVKLEDTGQNRVQVCGATGLPPPPTYKVNACYPAGYKAEGMLMIFGQDAYAKAKRCGQMVQERVLMAGYTLEHYLVECFAGGQPAGYPFAKENALEYAVRFAAADRNKLAIEAFTKEIAPLITAGPQGVYAYTAGRPKVRETFGFWPCLIERTKVSPQIRLI